MTTDELIKKDFLRHGEAVGLGMISEIALSYLETNNKNEKKKILNNLIFLENILKTLNLPIKLNLNKKIEKRNIYKKIFFYVFQDKKRLSDKPIYINFKNKGILNPKEIQNFDNINRVIYYLLNKTDIRTI